MTRSDVLILWAAVLLILVAVFIGILYGIWWPFAFLVGAVLTVIGIHLAFIYTAGTIW